jgi:hypothetical protein
MDKNAAARSAAKWLIDSIIVIKTTELAADVLTDHTRYDQDNFIVKVASGAVGGVVSIAIAPVVDITVDKTADFVTAKYQAFRTKRNDKKKDK